MIDFENLKTQHPGYTVALDIISRWDFDLVEFRKLRTYPGVTEYDLFDIIIAIGIIRDEGLADNEWTLLNKKGNPFPKVYREIEDIPKTILKLATDITLNTRLKR